MKKKYNPSQRRILNQYPPEKVLRSFCLRSRTRGDLLLCVSEDRLEIRSYCLSTSIKSLDIPGLRTLVEKGFPSPKFVDEVCSGEGSYEQYIDVVPWLLEWGAHG